MNLVDSSGWLEYFTLGPNAEFFSSPLQAVDDLLVPTITLYEVFRRTYGMRGRSSAYQAVAQMRRGQVVDLDRKLAVDAARIGQRRKLAMADSIILATAERYDATIWTQDEDFKDIEGVKYRAKASK